MVVYEFSFVHDLSELKWDGQFVRARLIQLLVYQSNILDKI